MADTAKKKRNAKGDGSLKFDEKNRSGLPESQLIRQTVQLTEKPLKARRKVKRERNVMNGRICTMIFQRANTKRLICQIISWTGYRPSKKAPLSLPAMNAISEPSTSIFFPTSVIYGLST